MDTGTGLLALGTAGEPAQAGRLQSTSRSLCRGEQGMLRGGLPSLPPCQAAHGLRMSATRKEQRRQRGMSNDGGVLEMTEHTVAVACCRAGRSAVWSRAQGQNQDTSRHSKCSLLALWMLGIAGSS